MKFKGQKCPALMMLHAGQRAESLLVPDHMEVLHAASEERQITDGARLRA